MESHKYAVKGFKYRQGTLKLANGSDIMYTAEEIIVGSSITNATLSKSEYVI